MKKGVKYIWDILREVAKEEGRSYEEVKELWRIHMEYVKDKIDEEDTYILEIPHIGNLYFSGFLYTLKDSKSRNKIDELRGKKANLVEMITASKNSEGKTKYIYPQERRPNINKLYKSINNHINNTKKKYTSTNKMIKQIEKYSNDEQDK